MGDFKATRLWRTTLAHSHDPHEAARDRLRTAFELFRERAALLSTEIARDAPDLTVHDVTHMDALWETADVILGPDYPPLTPSEAFVLGGAFLLHDLGLSLAAYPGGLNELKKDPQWNDYLLLALRPKLGREPDAGEIANPAAEVLKEVNFSMLRKLHAERAEHLAFTTWHDQAGNPLHLLEDYDLRNSFGPMIGKIAHSHWWPTAELESIFSQTPLGALVNLPAEWTTDRLKLALILRLADAAHIDARRAPSFLQALRRPVADSALHWTFQKKLHQVQRKDDWLVYTGQPFTKSEAQAWWLCYETLRMVDKELRQADRLNVDRSRIRFAARGVRGVEDPDRLRDMVPAEGWTPVDAQVRVGHVASLVSRLGGRELYGDDQSVPLRELIQNATDAVRARRVLEGRGEKWGTVTIRTGKDEHGAWLEVADEGVGMSEKVLTGVFLDFGSSFWSTPDAIDEFPSLVSKGFESTGRYGIGFFSVFMWGDRVRVTTRKYDEGMRATRVLEFDRGLELRPLLRPAEPSEFIQDGGTRVRVWLRGVEDANREWVKIPALGIEWIWDEEDPLSDWQRFVDRLFSPKLAASRLCPTLDVNLAVEIEAGNVGTIIVASDWLTIEGKDLLFRTSSGFGQIQREIAGKNIRPLLRDGKVVGRACVLPGREGCVTIGGFRCATISCIAGVLLGSSSRASRESADLLASPEEIARWASEQTTLLSPLDIRPDVQAECAAIIACLGGDIGSLPVGRAGDTWLSSEKITEWSRDKEWIVVIDEADEAEARNRGVKSFSDNVLVAPKDVKFLHEQRSPTTVTTRTGGVKPRGPILEAIARAWYPKKIAVWHSEVAVDDYEEVQVHAIEVRREEED